MVMANTAASAKIAPAIKARINTSRVAICNLDSPASTTFFANSAGARYAMSSSSFLISGPVFKQKDA